MKMINNSNVRLGTESVDDIKNHPFFAKIDWKNIRQTKAPFIPEIKNDYDTKYFEVLEPKEPFHPIKKKNRRKDIEYLGYTYKDSDNEEDIKLDEEFECAVRNVENNNKNANVITEKKTMDYSNSKNDNEDNKEEKKEGLNFSPENKYNVMNLQTKKIKIDTAQKAMINCNKSVDKISNANKLFVPSSKVNKETDMSPQPKKSFLYKKFGLGKDKKGKEKECPKIMVDNNIKKSSSSKNIKNKNNQTQPNSNNNNYNKNPKK